MSVCGFGITLVLVSIRLCAVQCAREGLVHGTSSVVSSDSSAKSPISPRVGSTGKHHSEKAVAVDPSFPPYRRDQLSHRAPPQSERCTLTVGYTLQQRLSAPCKPSRSAWNAALRLR